MFGNIEKKKSSLHASQILVVEGVGNLSESVKKGKFLMKNLFSDNID